MLDTIARKLPRFAALGAVAMLAACVITTSAPVFDQGDFAQPKALDGDWVSVPNDAEDDILKVKIAVNGKMWRAQPLKAGGKVDLQISPTLSMFGRYGFRNLDTYDDPNIPLPLGISVVPTVTVR